ncbi:unnamed protein product [Echinostoma caproni]|uniref:Uncharacterized protein n=1 Tax=Echinostoma caproni TaxID=27848 RepID=A0A3P8L4N5_9TREM|nr:unnamed protein product [Echinostoma caproni]
MTSSREDVDGTSAWNQWLIGQIPNVFAHMIEEAVELYESPQSNPDSIASVTQLSRNHFLARLLSCLPYQLDSPLGQAQTSGGLFYGLSAQLRLRLSRLPWLPVQESKPMAKESISPKPEAKSSLVIPGRMLLSPMERDESSESAYRPLRVLTDLLITQLNMYEPHSDLIILPTSNQSPDPVVDDGTPDRHIQSTRSSSDPHSTWLITRNRRDALLWLGVQTISVDSLLDLAGSLNQDDYIQLLSILGPILEPCALESSAVQRTSIGIGLPSLLIQPNPEGLDLKVALPEVVFAEWIEPVLEHLQLQTEDIQDPPNASVDWLLAVGQLYASLVCLSDCPSFAQLPFKLPLVIKDRAERSIIVPPLSCLPNERRSEPIFLPPTSFTIAAGIKQNPGSPEELETRLFEFLLNQLEGSDVIRLISVAYFTKPLSTDRRGCRWFQLFSEAGWL